MPARAFSIVVPVYNEEEGIAHTVEELARLQCPPGWSYEVILVDDGSSDGTGPILEELDLPPHFRVLRHHRNRGYGAALKTGIRAAGNQTVVITDADRTYPNQRIPELVERMLNQDFDMVVGSRVGPGARIPPSRRPAKWVLGKLANYLSGTRIPDLNSGLRVMKKSIVEQFLKILPDAFSFTTTITLAMLTNGYSVDYVPIDYQVRSGRSKIRPVQDTMYFLQLIIRTMLYFQPLKIFLPASGAFILASLLMLVYRMLAGGGFAVTATVLFICGIQLLALGMIADFLDKRL